MKKLLDAKEFEAAITKLAQNVVSSVANFENAALVGIHTRGVPLANRLAEAIKKLGKNVDVGMLDINLYRDDLSEVADMPVIKETKINFNVNGKTVFLVDDVLYTGRTIRAAMDAMFDLGRPKAVHLVVMAKRPGRELPIDTSLTALDVQTAPSDNIKVKFKETDDKDDVTILEKGEY